MSCHHDIVQFDFNAFRCLHCKMFFIGIDELHPDVNRLLVESRNNPRSVNIYPIQEPGMSTKVSYEMDNRVELNLRMITDSMQDIRAQMEDYKKSLDLLTEVLKDALSS